MKFLAVLCLRPASRRPPHGGRGLKFCKGGKVSLSLMSPPARGAWIEITLPSGCLLPGGRSPPARGAWIEIFSTPSAYSIATVAPRTGGVD